MDSDRIDDALREYAARSVDAMAHAASTGGKTLHAHGDERIARPIGSTHKLDAGTEEARINATLDVMFRLRHRAYPPALVVFAHGRRPVCPVLFDAHGVRV